jgi:hypothetical protein
MPLIEIYQNNKTQIEEELKDAYDEMIFAGVNTQGEYKIRIKNLERLLEDVNKKISTQAKSEVFKDVEPEQEIKIIRLFLASSSELKSERDQFEIFINRENNHLINQNKFLRLIVWEDFIDAMSKTRLQDEYDKAIRECDLFISLFNTKAGPFTEEEFNTAFGQYKENGKPLVYTYFKDTATELNGVTPEAESLLRFKSKLKALGHFYTTFSNIHDLKYQVKMQLEKVLPLLN